jgi:hypothetical protein
VAKRGDVFILHGLLPHVASFNHLHYARVITNPHVTLREPYNLNRPDGDYVSLVDPSFSIVDRTLTSRSEPSRTGYPSWPGSMLSPRV